MKRAFYILVTICIITSIGACSKGFDTAEEPEKDAQSTMINYSITAFIEDLAPSKATLDAVIRVTWTEGDKISVLDLTNQKILGNLTAQSTGTSVTFSGSISKPTGCTTVGYVYPIISDATTFPVNLSSSVESGVNFAAQDLGDRTIFCASAVDSNPGTTLGDKKIKFNIANSFISIGLTNLPKSTSINKIAISDLGSAISWSFTTTGITANTTSSNGITINSTLPSSANGNLVFGFSCPASSALGSEKTRKVSIYSNDYLIKYADIFGSVINRNEYIGTVAACHNLFSVAQGKYVNFSRGNLQASADNSGNYTIWSFAENQYESLLGSNVKTIPDPQDDTKQITVLNDKIDLFGWSAYNTTAKWGISTSANNTDYAGPFVDWGSNSDLISTELGSGWRTLTIGEWEYICNRPTKPNKKIKRSVTVCDVTNCVVLAPDNYSAEIESSYNTSTWSAAEKEGLVCLPPTGYRQGVGIDEDELTYNYYWSSTTNNDEQKAEAMQNTPSIQGSFSPLTSSRCKGYAVRLVRD